MTRDRAVGGSRTGGSATGTPEDGLSLGDALAALGEIVSREPFAYATSWPLELVKLRRADGGELRLVVKQVERVHRAKPGFVSDPSRETAVYSLLAGAGLETARCYASGRWWLALEHVDADPLWQSGELTSWTASAVWAARLHEYFSQREHRVPELLRHDRGFYRRWFERAVAARDQHATRNPSLQTRAERDAVAALEPTLEVAIDRLVALEPTLIHGELYPANVLIATDRVTAVDWEMAAIGPAVIDLAALVAGWHGDARGAIVAAYGEVDPRDLAAAEFVLAVQWLGWSRHWEPPPEQRHDWLSDAQRAAGALR